MNAPFACPRLVACPDCEGMSERVKDACGRCRGAGEVVDPEELSPARCDHATTGCWLPCECGHRCDEHGIVAGAPCGMPGCRCDHYVPFDLTALCSCGRGHDSPVADCMTGAYMVNLHCRPGAHGPPPGR